MPKRKTLKKTIAKKKKYSILSLQTKLFLLLGIILVLIPLFFYINEGVQLAFFTPHIVAVKKQQQFPPPVWISIPKIGIELPIEETALQGNSWQIADHAISHLNISSRPGEDGSIILYAHNTNDRFGPIRWLNLNDSITVNTPGNKVYTYKVVQIVEVNPAQVSILVNQQGQTLILYTCSGFADLKRFIVIAKSI